MSSTYTDRIDGLSTSVAVKAPVAASTTANITLSGLQTVDSVVLVAGNRVLVKEQTDTTENGIYEAGTSTWSREPDFDGNRDIVDGTLVWDLNSSIFYQVTTDNPIIIGTSSIVFGIASSLNISGLTEATTKAVMSALPPSSLAENQQISMASRSSAGDGGHGIFYVTKTDISSLVTADPQEAIYVPFDSDPTGASGGFIRQIVNIVFPAWWGAVGDEITNDFTAVQAFLVYLQENPYTDGILGNHFIDSPLILRGASNISLTGGKLKPGPNVYPDISRHHRLLYIIDCVNTSLIDVELPGQASAKPGTLSNSQRAVTVGSNTKTDNIKFVRCIFEFATTQPVVIESVERDSNADPIIDPTTVTTSNVSFIECLFKDSLGGLLTFNGGCNTFKVEDCDFENITGTVVKIDAEIRIGGSPSNPNNCPAMVGAYITNPTLTDCTTSGSNGFFSFEERITSIHLTNPVYNNCTTDSATAPFVSISPGQGEELVDGVFIHNTKAFGCSVHSMLRIAGGTGTGQNQDVRHTYMGKVLIRNCTEPAASSLISVENDMKVNLTIEGWDVPHHVDRFGLASCGVGSTLVVRGNKVPDCGDFLRITGPVDRTITNNIVGYDEFFLRADTNWEGHEVIEDNTLTNLSGSGTVADIDVTNSNVASRVDHIKNNWSVKSTFNTGQYRINITGTTIIGVDAANIKYNGLGSVYNGIRCVMEGNVTHNTASAFDAGSSRFINGVGVTMRGGVNVMSTLGFVPITPTAGYTSLAAAKII